ncbi:PEP-CTERM sorting domain-containing protein [Edaphobacter paludis]|uniref:PEP-CTERM sorting domain-containing protein n=1 Tax=Edaphobacter paludis TaxID=3035702 RepID=UPI0035A12495
MNYSLPSQSDVLTTTTVPEPSTAVLMTAGMFVLLIRRFRKKLRLAEASTAI